MRESPLPLSGITPEPKSKRAKKGLYQIPFRNGHQLHYPDNYPTLPEWRDNFDFTATLTFTGFNRGRSAAYAEFKNYLTGATFTMFLKDLDEVIKTCGIGNGKVEARWTFCKRGANYGLCLAQGPAKL